MGASVVQAGTGVLVYLMNHREVGVPTRARKASAIRRLRDSPVGSSSGIQLLINESGCRGITRTMSIAARSHISRQAVLDRTPGLVAFPSRTRHDRGEAPLDSKRQSIGSSPGQQSKQRQQVVAFHQRIQMSLSSLLVKPGRPGTSPRRFLEYAVRTGENANFPCPHRRTGHSQLPSATRKNVECTHSAFSSDFGHLGARMTLLKLTDSDSSGVLHNSAIRDSP